METKQGFGLSNGDASKSLSKLIDEETLEKLKREIKEEVENIEDPEKLANLMWKFILLMFLTKNTKEQRAGCGCKPIINLGGDVPITLLDAQTKDLGNSCGAQMDESISCGHENDNHIAEAGKKEE